MPQAFGTRIIAASDAQIHANRLSAQRSTGPQTENGKRADRYNALKHGLLAEASLLPGEDAALFRLLAEGGRKLAHLPRLALRDDAASKRRFAGAHLPYYEPGEPEVDPQAGAGSRRPPLTRRAIELAQLKLTPEQRFEKRRHSAQRYLSKRLFPRRTMSRLRYRIRRGPGACGL